MDRERWEKIQSLFHHAVGLDPPSRTPYLETECGGDTQLLAQILSMLEEDEHGSSLIDRGAGQAAAQALDASLSQREFGPYRIQRVLGEGGMGIVYFAGREDLGSVAAIKVLRDAWMSPSRRERFAVEQRTLARLSHPSIARLYDADTLPDGTPWFAMEYVEGVPITNDCLLRHSSIQDRLRLFRAVCEAVQYAHSHAVIHRDLKPSNILVQADGAVKLLDFGIAKQLDQTDSQHRTLTGLRLMTPAYAAPEQIRGQEAGIYSDVYSLGVILYELLTDQLPFDANNRQPGQEPLKPSQRARRAGWGDLDVLCLTAMHNDPQRRYGSAEALIRDIDHYLAGQPLEARPDSASYRIGKFLRRNQRAVAAAAVLFAGITGLVIYYTVRLAAARNEALAESARTQRVLRFTLNLFQGGDKDAGPATNLRVTELLDRGAAEAGALENEPEVQAELYASLGEVYAKLGLLDRADSLLHAALDRRKSLFGEEHPRVAESLVQIGLLRDNQAKLEEAEMLVRQGLEMSKRKLPPGHPGIAAATHALGKVLQDRGRYGEAIPVLQEAVRLRSAPGVAKAALAESLFELAGAHFYAGNYDRSEELNRRLLSMHREIYGARHPMVAEDLINLGAIQQERGNYPEAERYHRQALAITEAFYGDSHHKTATGLTLVARALGYQKRHQEAAELLARALLIQEKVFGKIHPRVASALNEMGVVALVRANYKEAEAVFTRTAEIYRSVYAGKHYLMGIALANLASVYMAQKQDRRAEPLFRQAIEIYKQTLPPGHLNEGITRIKLGRALLRQDRFAEAEQESLAGYEILSRQANPSVSWLQNAREDLGVIYTRLNQPDKAKKFLARAK